jgi:hypothetical protein
MGRLVRGSIDSYRLGRKSMHRYKTTTNKKIMSVISFLKKIWASIARLWQGLPAEMKSAVKIGVLVTENIKYFIDSPAGDILTALIPTNIDDKIKDLLRAKLPVILGDLRLIDATIGLTDPNEIAATAIKVLQSLNGDISNAFYHNLSILIAQVASDGKLTWSDGVYILEYFYQKQYRAD